MRPRENHLAKQSAFQEDQYNDPYHYLPELTPRGFRQHRYWSWGYRYLGRLQVVFDLLERVQFDSLLDIGCGDGRFLGELAKKHSGKRLAGIDISHKAIRLAKQYNQELDFQELDILDSSLNSQWDVISLMEVVEHISPDDLPCFMKKAASLLRPGGHLIITVPHKNEKIIPKHYQHFDTDSLNDLLPDDLRLRQCVSFDHISIILRIFTRLMGGSGRFFIISSQYLNNLLYRYYIQKCLYSKKERPCRRIALLAQKTPRTHKESTIGLD